MKSFGGTCISCLLLVVLGTGTGYCLEYSPPPALSAGGNPAALHAGIDEADARRPFGCADVAYTDIFRAKRLDYVHSPEFADAVGVVASGASKYSPPEIPAAWATIASDWTRHLGNRERSAEPAASPEFRDGRGDDGGLRLLREERILTPALVYLASMEYRSRRGHENVSLVFPWILRQASLELDALLTAKRRSAEEFSKRAAAIAAKISDAERKGAGENAPDMIARAKFELDCACRDAIGVHVSVRETEAAFDRAEKVADGIAGR